MSGRPSRSRRHIGFTVSPETDATLRRLAYERRTTLGDVIDAAIEEYSKMNTYNVEIRNINARVAKMKIAPDEPRTVTVQAEHPHDAIGKAVRKMFDGCGLHIEEPYGNDSHIGQITTGQNLYGRIRVTVTPA